MKKLPIWVQSFENIRKTWNTIYIDKTKYVYNLIKSTDNPKIFLSRPRRFWKSLLIDTIRCLFEWKKHLFEWLYIYDKWDFEIKYPVIKIVFWNWFIDSHEKLIKILNNIIEKNCTNNDIDFKSLKTSIPELRLEELIRKLYEKTWRQVVVLVDEYDKPILDKIEDSEISVKLKDEIKWFYSVLKWADEYLKFVMLTWVTKFSKVSVFSWLNNLNDITLNKKYNTICWYTYEEILESFWPEWYLEDVDLEQMKLWYNWYSFWDVKETVYNPFWLLNFFENEGEYRNYWFQTATPTYLIKLLKTYKYEFDLIKLEWLKVWNEILDSFDIEKIELKTLLFQSWYLTIKEIKDLWWEIIYKLWIPNEEVRKSLNNYLIKDYLNFADQSFNFDKLKRLYKVLWEWALEWYKEILQEIYAWIPYNSYTKNDISKYEWFYGRVLYSFMAFTWIEFIAEDTTNKWRVDFTMKIWDKVYIIELKIRKDLSNALEQIKEKKYYEKYQDWKKEIYLVWIEFDKEEKNIWKFEWERI
jgi:hypothetical protein